jgi:hypothetical protein
MVLSWSGRGRDLIASCGAKLIEEMELLLGVASGTEGIEGDFGSVVGWINSVKPAEDIV